MLFKRKFHESLARGEITLSFRRWSRPQVAVGRRYRVGAIGLIEVDAMERVRVAEITAAQARRSGFPGVDALVAELDRGSRGPLRASDRVFRVELHYAGPDDRPRPRTDAVIAQDDLGALAERLERMDCSSRHGRWTGVTLSIIARHPRVPASRLAAKLGRETQPFKADVRKLKKLGLTVSHDVGYELSPRGRTYLERALR